MPYRTPQKEDRAKVARSSIKRNRSDIAKWDSKRFDFDWKRTWRELDSVRLSTIFHRSVPFSWNKIEPDGGKHGRCSRDIRIYQPYLRNQRYRICFLGHLFDVWNRETSKRANKEIAGNTMKILLENDGTETYAKSTLESFWRKNYQTRLSTNSIDLEKTCCTSRLIKDLCLLHSSSHLGIILWPLIFLLAIFPLERDFVSFENWDFSFDTVKDCKFRCCNSLLFQRSMTSRASLHLSAW